MALHGDKEGGMLAYTCILANEETSSMILIFLAVPLNRFYGVAISVKQRVLVVAVISQCTPYMQRVRSTIMNHLKIN